MAFTKLELALLCLMGIALIHVSHAQNSPQDYLNAHITARVQVGVGPITWDNNVTAYAQNYANQRIGDCNLIHSGGPYGENLANSSGDLSGTAAVGLWVAEKSQYNSTANSCSGVCSHYTQVVSDNSVRLGCAKVRCDNGGAFVICCYDPPGNYVGQRPYDLESSPQDYLNAHNTARAEVGVGPMTWDNNVAAYAQNYANQRISDCNMIHSGGPYGENLARSSGDLSGKAAVGLWVSEKSQYNYNANSCSGVCVHYTQVVWHNSVRLGCAKVRCNNGGAFVICSYYPPGNYVRQRPYDLKSSSCMVELLIIK